MRPEQRGYFTRDARQNESLKSEFTSLSFTNHTHPVRDALPPSPFRTGSVPDTAAKDRDLWPTFFPS